ncbi:MAG: nuclear transport factor 2 family protein [Alcaligenaceae bacterium]|nr:MAG: nuclear transport factor 2 family protein [Alcaligenaceae bacterium]
MTARIDEIAHWFATLSPDTLASIGEVYGARAHFKDPFNDVVGIDAIERVYAHMFDGLTQPRFEIDVAQATGSHAFLVWRFLARWRAHDILVHGSTHLQLDQAGLIADHRDYWDTSEELFERIPLLGGALRAMRKKLATPLE